MAGLVYRRSLPERLPLGQVPEGLISAALGQTDRQGGDGDAPLVEGVQELGVARPGSPSGLVSSARQSSKDSSRVSEASQPTFEYFFDTVKPGVPAGTMMAEISLRPPVWPSRP